MTLRSANELYAYADSRGQAALPCFDVAGGNADIVAAVCAVLAESGACAFLSSTPQSIAGYLGLDQFCESIAQAQERFGVMVAAHLDHAEDPDDVVAGLEAGIRSVMYDGSAAPLANNIATSRRLKEIAHELGATIEAEVGTLSGKEDPGEAPSGRNAVFEDVAEFVAEVGPDLLAPAIGTIHGRQGGEARIDWDLAQRVAGLLEGRLVLHGTTGLPLHDVRRLVRVGYRKVNYATAVRDSYVAGLEQALAMTEDRPRPQALLAIARQEVGEFVRSTIEAIRDPVGSASDTE